MPGRAIGWRNWLGCSTIGTDRHGVTSGPSTDRRSDGGCSLISMPRLGSSPSSRPVPHSERLPDTSVRRHRGQSTRLKPIPAGMDTRAPIERMPGALLVSVRRPHWAAPARSVERVALGAGVLLFRCAWRRRPAARRGDRARVPALVWRGGDDRRLFRARRPGLRLRRLRRRWDAQPRVPRWPTACCRRECGFRAACQATKPAPVAVVWSWRPPPMPLTASTRCRPCAVGRTSVADGFSAESSR